MKLASIEIITNIWPHPNADALSICEVLGYKCIIRKEDNFRQGERVVFIQPDTVLPEADWSAIFKAKSSRVKAIRLRGSWSEGIVLKPSVVNLPIATYENGQDVSGLIGVTKYEPPAPQDLNAKGPLPLGIPKTDEERFNNIEDLPYGELVDVTLKVDGQSFTAYHKDGLFGVCGRTQEFKLDADNLFTRNFHKFDLQNILGKLDKNIALRGEQYGQGIQKNNNNPHCKLPPYVEFFSVWLIDERRYACKGDDYYLYNWASAFTIPTVPVLEQNVILTPELIKKYTEDLATINGVPFEGVVIQHSQGSFKAINKDYDAKK